MIDPIIKKMHKAEEDLFNTEGKLKYLFIRFGDHIAQREGYANYNGLDAIHFYLIQKYHWLPSQVRSMSDEDLRFLLNEEMSNWTLPADESS